MAAQPKIYLETSVISAYFDFWAKSPEQKKLTRIFWKQKLKDYKPLISSIIINELEAARPEWTDKYLKLIEGIAVLKFLAPSATLARQYTLKGIIPNSKADDAAHLAVTVTNKVDFFSPGICNIFLRPHQMNKIIEFNQRYGMYVPTLVKPSDFLDL